MKNRKLCILAGCVGVIWGTIVAAQPAASGSDDQSKALEALRKAEAEPIVVDQSPVRSPAPAPAPAAAPAPAVAPEPAVAPAPAPAVVSAPSVAPAPAAQTSPDDQSKALEALRHAEATPVAPDQVTNPQMTAAEKEAQLIENQRELKAAEEKNRADREAEKKARKAAEKQARIAKAQAEAAQHVEQLRQQMQNTPAPAPAATPGVDTRALSTKEQKLADLLRRYNADEITPYEYHMERAKIIAEP